MKDKTFKLQGMLTYNISCPESVQEFDTLLGPGSCLRYAIERIVLGGPASKAREILASALEKETKISRAEDETTGNYITRVGVEAGLDTSAIQKILDAALKANPIPFKAARRGTTVGGGPRASKKDIEVVRALLKTDQWKAVVAKWQKVTGRSEPIPVEEEAKVNFLARLRADYRRKLEDAIDTVSL